MMIVKSDKKSEAGILPDVENAGRHGQVQRRNGEGRRDAGWGRTAGELEGRARPVLQGPPRRQ
nr:unknown [uncultured bacterium]